MVDINPRQQQALAAFEREADAMIDALHDRLRTRTEGIFQQVLRDQGTRFSDMLEAMLRQTLDNVLAGATPRRSGFGSSALQRGADLLASLERAKRNL